MPDGPNSTTVVGQRWEPTPLCMDKALADPPQNRSRFTRSLRRYCPNHLRISHSATEDADA